MIRIEYDAKSAGVRFSFIATDSALVTLPTSLKELIDMGEYDKGEFDDLQKLYIPQNSITLTVLRDALDHCIKAEKKNEEYRDS